MRSHQAILLMGAGVIAIFILVFSKSSFKQSVLKHDYQIDIYNDTLWLYDKERLVGRVVDTSWNSPIMELISKDNQ